MKYEIRCKVYFLCQDGYDYIDNEADGELYNTKEEAIKRMKDYEKIVQSNYEFHVEEVEE